MLIQFTKSIFQTLRLMPLLDRCRFVSSYLFNLRRNTKFKQQHPDFTFPPAYAVYETYHLNFEHYHDDGLQTAKDIIHYINKFHLNLSAPKKILDWGCGPGRVIRHIPQVDANYIAYGSDYNGAYVAWCQENIKQVIFKKNELSPPLNFDSNMFEVVYALSIITHLSATRHIEWAKELLRVLKPNGYLLITTHGDAFKHILLPPELADYLAGKIVIRDTQIEGNRTYAAFHPKAYIEQLFSAYRFVDFVPGGHASSIHGKQDTWLFQKF